MLTTLFVLLGCAVMAAVAFFCLWLGTRRALNLERTRVNRLVTARETTVREAVAGVAEKLEKIERALDGDAAAAAAQKDFASNLDKLMAYSMDEALKAARPKWGDGE